MRGRYLGMYLGQVKSRRFLSILIMYDLPSILTRLLACLAYLMN